MRWSDIMWQKHPYSASMMARLSFGTYELSIVEERGETDLFECAIFELGEFVQLPGIHPEPTDTGWDDDVLRFQTREEVIGIVRKLESITGKAPLNVYD